MILLHHWKMYLRDILISAAYEFPLTQGGNVCVCVQLGERQKAKLDETVTLYKCGVRASSIITRKAPDKYQ